MISQHAAKKRAGDIWQCAQAACPTVRNGERMETLRDDIQTFHWARSLPSEVACIGPVVGRASEPETRRPSGTSGGIPGRF